MATINEEKLICLLRILMLDVLINNHYNINKYLLLYLGTITGMENPWHSCLPLYYCTIIFIIVLLDIIYSINFYLFNFKECFLNVCHSITYLLPITILKFTTDE